MLECIYVYSYVCRYMYVCIQVSMYVMHSWNTKPISSKVLITLFQDNFTEFFLANSIFFLQWDALWKFDLMRENFSYFKHRQAFIIHLKIEHDLGFYYRHKASLRNSIPIAIYFRNSNTFVFVTLLTTT